MRVPWSRYQAHKRGIKNRDTLSHSIHTPPGSAAIDMKIGLGSGRESSEDKAVKTFGNCAS
jgi:hypothetical protein